MFLRLLYSTNQTTNRICLDRNLFIIHLIPMFCKIFLKLTILSWWIDSPPLPSPKIWLLRRLHPLGVSRQTPQLQIFHWMPQCRPHIWLRQPVFPLKLLKNVLLCHLDLFQCQTLFALKSQILPGRVIGPFLLQQRVLLPSTILVRQQFTTIHPCQQYMGILQFSLILPLFLPRSLQSNQNPRMLTRVRLPIWVHQPFQFLLRQSCTNLYQIFHRHPNLSRGMHLLTFFPLSLR